MLKYTIFEEGVKQDLEVIRCPNCKTQDMKTYGADNVYICKKCFCKFLVEDELNQLNKLDQKSTTIYEIKDDVLTKLN